MNETFIYFKPAVVYRCTAMHQLEFPKKGNERRSKGPNAAPCKLMDANDSPIQNLEE